MFRVKLVGALAALAALYGCWIVVRNAPVFAVRKVEIVGLTGDSAPALRSALEQAARQMTTTHVQLERLRAAVASYAIVKQVHVQSHFPHGLTIRVTEQTPVAALVAGTRRVALASDGTILRDVGAPSALATVNLARIPSSAHISDPFGVSALELLDIAPPVLRARVARVTGGGAQGLTAYLRNGPALYFGDATRLHAKWAASARVLSDAGSRGALYLDLRIPERPIAQIGDPATNGGVNGALPMPSTSSGG